MIICVSLRKYLCKKMRYLLYLRVITQADYKINIEELKKEFKNIYMVYYYVCNIITICVYSMYANCEKLS